MTEPRRLYRDPKAGMVAGVCAGLAEYLRVDATVVRVAAAGLALLGLFARGVPSLLVVAIYVAMWILVPPRPEDPATTPVRA